MNDAERAEYDALLKASTQLSTALGLVRERMSALLPMTSPHEYRIALRPDEHGADPLSIETLLDDIVVNNVPMFRAEQMSLKNWWVACYLDGNADQQITWSVTARSKPLRLEWVTTDFPDVVYEHEVKGP